MLQGNNCASFDVWLRKWYVPHSPTKQEAQSQRSKVWGAVTIPGILRQGTWDPAGSKCAKALMQGQGRGCGHRTDRRGETEGSMYKCEELRGFVKCRNWNWLLFPGPSSLLDYCVARAQDGAKGAWCAAEQTMCGPS